MAKDKGFQPHGESMAPVSGGSFDASLSRLGLQNQFVDYHQSEGYRAPTILVHASRWQRRATYPREAMYSAFATPTSVDASKCRQRRRSIVGFHTVWRNPSSRSGAMRSRQ